MTRTDQDIALTRAGWPTVADHLLAGIVFDLRGRATSLIGMTQLLALEDRPPLMAHWTTAARAVLMALSVVGRDAGARGGAVLITAREGGQDGLRLELDVVEASHEARGDPVDARGLGPVVELMGAAVEVAGDHAGIRLGLAFPPARSTSD